jgi:hypothetical protein
VIALVPAGPPHHRKMASVYCQAVLCHDQRITLDGAPAEPVAEAKDMAQLARLAARKAATNSDHYDDGGLSGARVAASPEMQNEYDQNNRDCGD